MGTSRSTLTGRLGEDAVVEVFDHGAEIDRFVAVGAVFGDFFFFHDTETEAFENFGTAAFLEGYHLPEDFLFSVGAEVVEELEAAMQVAVAVAVVVRMVVLDYRR